MSRDLGPGSDDEVVVTGVGMIGPLGRGLDPTWVAARGGRHGIVQVPPEVSEVVPEVRVWAPVATAVENGLVETRADRSVRLGSGAADDAMVMARLGSDSVDGTRLAVSMSCGWGGLETTYSTVAGYVGRGRRSVRATTVPRAMPNALAATVAMAVGAHAGAYGQVSACASGAEAIALGWRLIRLGEADVVVCGGAEAPLHPLTVAGFAALRALSVQRDPAVASRPFEAQRDGFVLGEGAAALVLERGTHARARRASVLARVAGVGVTSDAHHLVAPDPTGAHAARAMGRALQTASLSATDVSAVSAHATGTSAGDRAEARAIHLALGPIARSVPVTALKASTGHLIGASGPAAAALAIATVRDRLVAPVPNFVEPDPQIELDVCSEPRQLTGDVAVLVNAFGFGGHDVSLCFTS